MTDEPADEFISGLSENEPLFMDVTGKELLFLQMFDKYLSVCDYSEIKVGKDKSKNIPKCQPGIIKSLIQCESFKDYIGVLDLFFEMLILYNDLRIKRG